MSIGTETGPEIVSAEEQVAIDRLIGFLANHAMRSGQPQALVAFADRLTRESVFRSALAAEVRAIAGESGEALSRGQIMRLLVVAGGGPAVAPGMPELQEALWQIAALVNEIFDAQAATGVGEVPQAPVEATGADQVESRSDLEGRDTAVPQPSVLVAEAPRTAGRNPGAETAHESLPVTETRTAPARARVRAPSKVPGWLLPAGAFLAAACVLLYLLWPSSPSAVVARSRSDAAAAASHHPPTTGTMANARARVRLCVGPIRPGVTRAGIEERSLWAHRLLDQQLYEVALPQLRALEAVNPGYPGVALDESKALRGMGQLDAARTAIDTQVKTSACLAGLPEAAMAAYCEEEFAPADVASCQPAMAKMQASAELQAATVHLELANKLQPDQRTEAALAALSKTSRDRTPGRRERSSGGHDPRNAGTGEPSLPLPQ